MRRFLYWTTVKHETLPVLNYSETWDASCIELQWNMRRFLYGVSYPFQQAIVSHIQAMDSSANSLHSHSRINIQTFTLYIHIEDIWLQVWENSCGISVPVNLYHMFYTNDIKFVHKCKVVLVWSLTLFLNHIILNYVILLYFSVTFVYTMYMLWHTFCSEWYKPFLSFKSSTMYVQ